MTLGYLCAVGIAVIFMLYMDGSIGVMMLAFLLLMPVLSLLVTLWVRRSLTVTLITPDSAAKHKAVTATLRLEKKTRIPVPFLRVLLTADAHFVPLQPNADAPMPRPEPEQFPSDAVYRKAYQQWKRVRRSGLVCDTLPMCLSMGTAQSAEYTVQLTPRYCGKAMLTLGMPELSDFLGMFRFSLKQDVRAAVLITPEIPEVKANNALFRTVSNAVQTADEELDSTPVFSASSAPGYEHREYIAGDPLKRINWKLSSKRRHLMVRKDEPVALARLSVVLDFRRLAQSHDMAACFAEEEQLTETALGFLRLCAQYGYPCRMSYPDEAGAWCTLSVDDAGQLETEAVTLLRGGFRDPDALAGVPLLPYEVMQESGVLLLYFTVNCDAATAAQIGSAASGCYIVTPQSRAVSAVVPKDGSLWTVTPDRQLVSARHD